MLLAISLVTSSIPSQSIATFAETNTDNQYTAENLQRVLTTLDPFMTINDDKSLTFDQQSAYKSGVATNDIAVGLEFVEMQNELISQIKEDGFSSVNIDNQKVNKFEHFFLSMATGTTLSPSSSSSSGLLDFVCGGGPDSPHPCPDYVNSGIYYTTQSGIENYIQSQGFHKTPGYAGDSYDWTLGCGHFSCSSPTFRTHARVFFDTYWTYWTQHPEPNPEILGYSWPAYWWGSYVYWWHMSYC